MESKLQLALDIYLIAIRADYIKWMSMSARPDATAQEVADRMIDEFCKSVRFEVGSKYIKVITDASVHSFIVASDGDKQFKRGDVLKAASWKAPARNFARGNVLDGTATPRWTGA